MPTPPSAVLIVGSMAFDDLELPTANVKDVVGGSATYASYAASTYAPVRAVAVVGDDFPRAELEKMRGRSIDASGVELAHGKTFRWAGRYDANLASRTTLDTQLNVFADFRPKLPAAFADAPYVLLGNIHPALQLEVLEQVSRPKLVVADTMNFWIEGEPQALAKVLARVDLLVINEEEARQLSGIHNISRAARDVLKRGPKRVVVKRGEYGALFFDDTATFFAPAYPLEDVIDPTGAGDTFAGAMLGYVARTGDVSHRAMRTAIMVGSAAASYCVEAIGPSRVAELSAADIAHRLNDFRALIDVPADGHD